MVVVGIGCDVGFTFKSLVLLCLTLLLLVVAFGGHSQFKHLPVALDERRTIPGVQKPKALVDGGGGEQQVGESLLISHWTPLQIMACLPDVVGKRFQCFVVVVVALMTLLETEQQFPL